MVIVRKGITFLLILLLAGCATINPNFEEPGVTVSAFRVLPSNGLPRFEVRLHITNPNFAELKLRGISYSASIEGNKVFSGVANQIPVIPSYGEGEVKLSGGIDLFGSFQLLTDLMQQQNTDLNYTLNVKLDAGNFIPNIHIEKVGQIIPPSH